MESRRAWYSGECVSCGKKIRRGEMVFIDKRTGWDGWLLWHFPTCAERKALDAHRKPRQHVPRVWIDTKKFKLPWSRLEASSDA